MNKNLKSTVFLLLLFSLLLSMQDPGLAQRRSKKGWLGVSVREMTPSMRKEFDLGDRGGLLIDDVIEDSPADDARLWEDDIILEYNGQPVEFADEFSRMVRKTAPETKVKLLIWRDGKEKEVEVTLGRNRSRRQMVWSGTDLQVFSDRPRLGVQVHDLDADLAEYFKVKENAGVLIIEVAEDSPAEDAG
ncbi:MAG: PDZ domain-containing protein, partial [bacterium]